MPSVVDRIRERVREIAEERDLPDHQAFAYYFLEDIEEFSSEEAESIVVDGPWDKGRDAVYYDEGEERLSIYQFKYSDDVEYVKSALRDIQRAVIAERDHVQEAESINLVIVTIAHIAEDVLPGEEISRIKRQINDWIEGNLKKKVDIDIRVFDLTEFVGLTERIQGVDIPEVTVIKESLYQTADPFPSLLVILNLVELAEYVTNESFFSINIRKFLGITKRSIANRIMETLKDPNEIRRFWIYNNGIVGVCSEFKVLPGNGKLSLRNFTIVNGAQTIGTVARFIEENPSVDFPIWVLAKIIKVDEADFGLGLKITTTSNSQTSTSTKDLKAIDRIHPIIKGVIDDMGLFYKFRRGDRVPIGRSSDKVEMKDLAQSYVAFKLKKPHIAFARAGKIFGDEELYRDVFPYEKFLDLQLNDTESLRKQIIERVAFYELLNNIRVFLKNISIEGAEKKWKSFSYHILWAISEIVVWDDLSETKVSIFLKKILEKDTIIEDFIKIIYEDFVDFVFHEKLEIPRDLKVTRFQEKYIGLLLHRRNSGVDKFRDIRQRMIES